MNHSLFFFFHGLAHQTVLFDKVVIFIADQFDKIAFGIVVVFFTAFFFIHRDWKGRGLRIWTREAVSVFVSVFSAWGIAELIKAIVKAPRPFILFPDSTPLFIHGGYDSFPSGHATVFFALATIIYTYHKTAGVFFFIFAILIALSRVIAGIHFPIDILIGAIIGIVIGRLVFSLFRKFLPRL